MTDIRQSIRDNVVTAFTGLSTTDLRNKFRHHGGGIFVARDKLKFAALNGAHLPREPLCIAQIRTAAFVALCILLVRW